MEINGTRKQLAEEYAIRIYAIGPTEADRQRAIRAMMQLTRKQMVEQIQQLLAKGR